METTMTLPTPAPCLEIAAACSSTEQALKLGQALTGTTYVDHREDTSKLPFAALVTTVTDNLSLLQNAADVGLYLVCRRVIKPGAANVYGLFPMHKHPQKSHEEADAHWRDVHGPLALEHHAFMSHYVQLSVLHTFTGAAFDGFALCGFKQLSDLKERFFTTEESREIIAQDIQNFADTKSTARRLIVEPHAFASAGQA